MASKAVAAKAEAARVRRGWLGHGGVLAPQRVETARAAAELMDPAGDARRVPRRGRCKWNFIKISVLDALDVSGPSKSSKTLAPFSTRAPETTCNLAFQRFRASSRDTSEADPEHTPFTWLPFASHLQDQHRQLGESPLKLKHATQATVALYRKRSHTRTC